MHTIKQYIAPPFCKKISQEVEVKHFLHKGQISHHYWGRRMTMVSESIVEGEWRGGSDVISDILVEEAVTSL